MKHEIRIYGEIGNGPEKISAREIMDHIDVMGLRAEDDLIVRISSAGGSVVEGLAIYHSLRDLEARVITVVDSLAASIASLIFMAGEERRAPRESMLMIHNPRLSANGTAEQFRAAADQLDKWASLSIEAYAQTGLSPERIKAMLSKDTWLTATEAKALGFVTHLTDEEPVVMALDLSQFSSIPKEALRLVTPGAEATPKEVKNMTQDTPQNVIDAEKLTQFSNEFGAENAVAWISLDYSEALKKHCDSLKQSLSEKDQQIESLSQKVGDLEAQLQAVNPGGEADPVEKGAPPEEGKGPKSLAGLIKLK